MTGIRKFDNFRRVGAINQFHKSIFFNFQNSNFSIQLFYSKMFGAQIDSINDELLSLAITLYSYCILDIFKKYIIFWHFRGLGP